MSFLADYYDLKFWLRLLCSHCFLQIFSSKGRHCHYIYFQVTWILISLSKNLYRKQYKLYRFWLSKMSNVKRSYGIYCISEINTPPFLLSERQEETSAPNNFFCLICYCPYIVMNVLRVPIFVKFDRWDSNCHPFMIVLTITATFMGNTTMTCFHHIFNE